MTIEQMWVAYSESKDLQLRNDIIMHYLGMVQKVVYPIVRSAGLYHLTDDFNSIGVLGLIDAVDKFDVKKNVSFETYASIRIKGTIKDYMRKQDPLSRGMRETQKNLELAKETFYARNNREPTYDELAVEAGLPKCKVTETLSCIAYAETVSFEEEIGENLKICETLQSDEPDLDSQIVDIETVEKLKEAIDSLSDREQKIIALYYKEELRLKDIAYILDISEGRVCQIMKKALTKLRTWCKEDEL